MNEIHDFSSTMDMTDKGRIDAIANAKHLKKGDKFSNQVSKYESEIKRRDSSTLADL